MKKINLFYFSLNYNKLNSKFINLKIIISSYLQKEYLMEKKKNKSIPDEKIEKLIQEYNKIMEKSQTTFITNVQWKKKGDNFSKFTLYKNYSPVKTSGNTTFK